MPAILAWLVAKTGISVSMTFIKYAAAVIAFLSIAVAMMLFYHHVENNRRALIEQATLAGQEEIKRKVEQASLEAVRKMEAAMQVAIEKKNAQDSASQANWDDAFSQVDALPDLADQADDAAADAADDAAPAAAALAAAPMSIPSFPTAAQVAKHTKSKPHVHLRAAPSQPQPVQQPQPVKRPQVDRARALRDLDGSLNRMLEQGSDFGAP